MTTRVVCSCGSVSQAESESLARQYHRNHVALATWGEDSPLHRREPAEVVTDPGPEAQEEGR